MTFGAAFRFALCCALALWVGGAPFAAPGRAVEICAADGPKVLLIGPDGAPQAPTSLSCEHCLLCAAIPSPETALARPVAYPSVLARRSPQRRPRRLGAPGGTGARAPPAAVLRR